MGSSSPEDEAITYPSLKQRISILQQPYSIKIYNEQRPHLSIGMLTPQTVHQNNIKTEKLWRNYYQTNRKIVNELQDIDATCKPITGLS